MATIINPSATRKYIQSNHPVQDRSLIPSRLQAVKQSLLDAAQRAIDLERKDAEMEDVMEADQIRKMEEERRDRFERSKYIGSWINETLRHTSTRYPPYSTTFATPPISKHSQKFTLTPPVNFVTRLPSISTMLAQTSLQTRTAGNNSIPYISNTHRKPSRGSTIDHLNSSHHSLANSSSNSSSNSKPPSSSQNESRSEASRFSLGSPFQLTVSSSVYRAQSSLLTSSVATVSTGSSTSFESPPPMYREIDVLKGSKEFEARLLRRSEDEEIRRGCARVIRSTRYDRNGGLCCRRGRAVRPLSLI